MNGRNSSGPKPVSSLLAEFTKVKHGHVRGNAELTKPDNWC